MNRKWVWRKTNNIIKSMFTNNKFKKGKKYGLLSWKPGCETGLQLESAPVNMYINQ